ncbi:MAG: hypothetical protein AB9907_04780 [Flexilinea sp.]
MEQIKIAYFISSHGFGHAARSAAIMSEVNRQNPQIRFDIFTETPEWFFRESDSPFQNLYPTASDVGIVQISPMEMDIQTTRERVSSFLSKIESEAYRISNFLISQDYRLVICDISPLGIRSAQKANIPSILFENFTWDWIYQPFEKVFPAFVDIDNQLSDIFSSADHHCRMIPFCDDLKKADRVIPPVSREQKQSAIETRRRLGILEDQKMGLISMGGIPENFEDLPNNLFQNKNIVLVLAGKFSDVVKNDSLILLPHHSDFYHPDLVAAADFIIGKAGYSTIAEVHAANIPFGYILRPDFRESIVLGEYLNRQSNTLEVKWGDFERFDLSGTINQLLSMDCGRYQRRNGSNLAADFILQKLQEA